MSGKILIVDDSATIRQQVYMILSHAGYEVILAPDVRSAMEHYQTIKDIKLIITDICMPDRTGNEFVRDIQEKGNKIPIMVMSTVGIGEEIETAKSLGVKCWIVKPFKPLLLVEAIEAILGESAG